jgi:ADP-ribose pyrophosphatase
MLPTRIRRAFDGRVFSVTVESITLPRGDALDAEIVRHPGSVVLIPVLEDGAIILVRQYRHPIGRMAWELPAGSLKHGEEPNAAAARECQEEIGLVPERLTHVGALYPTPGYCDEEMHFFVATGLRQPSENDVSARQDDDEDIESRAFSIDDMRRLVTDGTITDMKTVAGLALYLGYAPR